MGMRKKAGQIRVFLHLIRSQLIALINIVGSSLYFCDLSHKQFLSDGVQQDDGSE